MVKFSHLATFIVIATYSLDTLNGTVIKNRAVSTSKVFVRNTASRADGACEFRCPNIQTDFYPLVPGACNKYYYVCHLGQPYAQECPDGSLFDEVQHSCDLIENVSCTVQACDKPNGIYAYGPCQPNYYLCIDGTLFNEFCPNNSVFEESAGTCVPEAECTAQVTSTSSPSSFHCPNNDTGFYPISPGSCKPIYFTCYQGEAYPQKCPDGTVFDENTHSCEFPENVDACNPFVLSRIFNETPL